MQLDELLHQFEQKFGNVRDKGTAFEELIKNYFLLDPLYSNDIEKIWMWSDFPYRGKIGDTGIDLVAKTYMGEYRAIQCKFYAIGTQVTKPDVDTFLATSSKVFYVDGIETKFTLRYFVSTTSNFTKNAEDALTDQNPRVIKIGMDELLNSPIDWDKFALSSNNELTLKKRYGLRPHQKAAIKDVLKGFETHERGKLIMACGTGKTYTSLRCAEELLKGKGNILFLVPSIALLNQTLTEWASQSNYSFASVVVCSDNKASKNADSTELIDDLQIPSTTNIETLKRWINYSKKLKKNMNYVFSTYQSIEKVSEMQKETGFHFDLIICDEAHRTTGVTLSGEDESYFTKIHSNEFIKADKRLYMTATPRVYGNAVKEKANDNDALLCSMDDENIYGPEFHCLTFGNAVEQGLLTDYKVLILAIDEDYVKKELQNLLTDGNHEIKLDDATKIMGCWKGLSKITIDPNDISFKADPQPMKRAVAFTNRIKDSQSLVESFNEIQRYMNENHPQETENLVNVEIQHIDGSFNAIEKKKSINWLKEDTDEQTCRILTNARCLSEGIDVPALDAVMFLNPRTSIVDIIQSVGRVMRKSEGKQYGYIVLPVGISASEEADEALDNNEKYKIVWDVLQALRSHDDRFDNTINKINLNKNRPNQIAVVGIGADRTDEQDADSSQKASTNPQQKIESISLDLRTLEEWQNSIYAKMVKKVGSRLYWERWATKVAGIATAYTERINLLLAQHDKKIDTAMLDFVEGLKNNLNSSITQEDAIEMLAQHLITKPVFDALFGNYEFVGSNPVSQSMERMLKILDNPSMNSEKEGLEKFYDSVKKYVDGIDNSAGKQKIVVELYEKFFKVAMEETTEKLGIVYTPVQCVDFIIKSIEHILNDEFGKSLGDKNVHIIDGFTGTGTFIVRLLQSGIIKKEDLLYKYTNEIHANEIVLLAYYIAAINIEETFHEITGSKEYVPFEGIVMTDTFQLYEGWKDDEFSTTINEEVLPYNSERAKKQRALPITVALGNPPYSAKQRSSDDHAENVKYPLLDQRIADTYITDKKITNINQLYDSYIRAFRWASDRISDNGVIGFITNAGFIDSRTMAGFRKCLLNEFTSIYIFNLRGNQRTSGEQSKKEGGKIFGSGSRAPIAITCLVKNQQKKPDNFVHYFDIGDYLNREQKLAIISEKSDISKISWQILTPDENEDWINKRSNNYKSFIPLQPFKRYDQNSKSVFIADSLGIGTARDAWVYGYNKQTILSNMKKSIDFYNQMVNDYKNNSVAQSDYKDFIKKDKTSISWSSSLDILLKNQTTINYENNRVITATYRPFCKEYLYFGERMIHRPAHQEEFYKNGKIPTLCIAGATRFSAMMVDSYVDYNMLGVTHAYPLFRYVEQDFIGTKEIIKEDCITDYVLTMCQKKYKTSNITKEDIFYYIYGLCNSKEFAKSFETDFLKDSARIPFVKSYDDFKQFSEGGKDLSELHLNYENVKPCPDVIVKTTLDFDGISDSLKYKVDKMRYENSGSKATILFNDYIKITKIPEKAYEYSVNGRTPIDWIMRQYAITTDKDSGIVNDPNDICIEKNNPKYILNLLLSIINVSVKTAEIIYSFPKLDI